MSTLQQTKEREDMVMMFDRRVYRRKVRELHQRILEDLTVRGVGDEEIHRTFCKGVEQETILFGGHIVGWVVKVYLDNCKKPVTYSLLDHDEAELICDTAQFTLEDV